MWNCTATDWRRTLDENPGSAVPPVRLKKEIAAASGWHYLVKFRGFDVTTRRHSLPLPLSLSACWPC
ncbi:hypothetical protein KCP69_11860 [Salmonella enterica subsp. enterica]|nr:hypothetical protein KCP69_11860 [Salmonella enterica subsp. enterica]